MAAIRLIKCNLLPLAQHQDAKSQLIRDKKAVEFVELCEWLFSSRIWLETIFEVH